MALPWVRLDSNIGSHDKILDLLADPSPKRYQAAASYMFSIAWSGGQGTDGRIPRNALMFVHGNATTASLLCKYRLWEARTADWLIVNYADRQLSNEVAEELAEKRALGANKGGCRKNHGAECWRNGRCSRAA